MKKLLTTTFVALLLVGCGGEDAEKKAVQNEAKDEERDDDLEVLAKIKKARESGATVLDLYGKEITNLSPLAGLTNLELLWLEGNPIPEDQKAMLKKALPKCDIRYKSE